MRVITTAFLLVVALSSTAQAQYFGRNKVQYQEFKFEVLKTEHFDIYFYDKERASAARVGRLAERWYARLSQIFNHQIESRQPLVLYASHPDFEQTNVVGGSVGEGTGGVTEGLKRRVVLPLAPTLAETDHVLGHELVHAFQYDIAARRRANGGSGGGVEALPLWFIEGMAEYFSIGPVDPHTAMWIRDAARKEKLPEIKDLDNPKYFPYRWGQALWAYIGGTYGDASVARIYRDALRSGNLDLALKNTTAQDAKELSARWHDAIRDQYTPILRSAARAATFGRLLTTGDKSPNAMNVSPSISPDGTRFVYFSSRDMLSVDLFLAETATGNTIRKLIDTATDPHFSTLQFISSAGAWSPNSRQFVVPGVHAGKAVLAILDIANGNVAREIEIPDAGEILNPSWSPDGKSIAFSATVGGDSDLFVYNLDTSTERRLTNDVFADLQPAWSPDGRSIAFVTDRFTTRLSNLQPGDYQIALFDVAGGNIQPVRTFGQGKNINPQWNPDGRHVYFVSDRTGISNLYSVDLSSGSITQITNVDSGLSGITALSPAISSAIDTRVVAFSAYEEGSYHVYLVEKPEQLAGTPLSGTDSRLLAAGLPPAKRESTVAQLLADYSTGLPSETASNVEPYRTKLSLDQVGQPYISAGVDRFGGMIGGGMALNWSDMLGNHNMYAQVSTDTYGTGFADAAKNTGVLFAYTNLTKRWNWGIGVEQAPYLAGGYAQGIDTVGGESAFIDQTIIQRQTNRGVTGMVSYPFTLTHRIEFNGGVSLTSFEEQVRTTATSIRTGQVVADDTTTTQLGDPLHLNSVSTALVSDNSVFGATSPIAGYRSRFEVSPTFGTLRMTTALADYRRYFMPARFYTLAVRGLHYGRYGTNSEDPRLIPLFIGYPEFVRGYGINSFQSGECSTTTTCPTFDRMVGTRMMVGNVEFRFPLLRPFGVTDRMYGPLPVEVAFFLDGGVAWNRGEKPSLFNGGTRKPVTSGGVSFRTNLFGYAVAQVDLAQPFDRPGRGWVWGFSLTPGF